MKGLFYSIMIALFIIPILFLILFYSQTEIPQDIGANIRSNEMQYFSQGVEKDLKRFLQINGKRTLISATSEVISTGSKLEDAQSNLTEMIMYGTLNGTSAPLVEEKNFMIWEQDIKSIASLSGFNIEFKNVTINISQYDNFHVLFNTTIYVNISDYVAGIYILKNITVNVPVSIDSIDDPLFSLKTNEIVSRIIKISQFNKKTIQLTTGQNITGLTPNVNGYSYNKPAAGLTDEDVNASRILITDDLANAEQINIASQFAGVVSEGNIVIPQELVGKAITGATGAMTKVKNETKIYLDIPTKGVWDLSNLTSDIKNGYYHDSTAGASFLDRLEGNTTLSTKYYPYGLESFVYLPNLMNPNLQSSVLDYQYWADVDGSLLRSGNLNYYDSIYSWFRIVTLAENDYGINDLIG